MRITMISLGIMAIAFASCSKYQYATVTSNLKKEQNGSIVFESDTMRVAYNFAGINLRPSLNIYNKLNVPLYVNWERSAIILDKRSISNYNQNATISGVADVTQFRWTPNVSSGTGTISGTIQASPAVSFIPPQSFIESPPIVVADRLIEIPKSEFATRHLPTGTVLVKSFDQENSPVKFRSYLTLSTVPDFSTTITLDNEFWIADVLQSSYRIPEPQSSLRRNDQYVTQKATGFGVGLGTVALVSLFVIYLAAQN